MIFYNNRGQFLEQLINRSNSFFDKNNLALICKIGINININKKNAGEIKGYLDNNLNCDYIGIFKGSYIEFDAKETSKEYFPFQNIAQKQINKLLKVKLNNGIAFLLIYFQKYNRFFVIDIEAITEYIKTNPKRIPLDFFELNGFEVFVDDLGLLQYLKPLNSLIK